MVEVEAAVESVGVVVVVAVAGEAAGVVAGVAVVAGLAVLGTVGEAESGALVVEVPV